ncbi:MAG: hypothetical protein PVS3B3_17320 [Ktedonobacteraceae bacterium]
MADYTTISMKYNKGTDASTDFTGTAVSLSGSAGANELRMALTGGGTSIASASWPYMAKPVSGTTAVTSLYAYTSDSVGLQVATYTGDNTKARVLQWSFDNTGNPVTAMQVGAFANSTHTAPSPGTQPPGTNNDAFTNGHSSDTSSRSYFKFNLYGSGLTASGSQETPSAGTVGTLPTATTGTTGSVTTTAGNWLNANGAWQDAMGFIDYITGVAIPQTATAFVWYMAFIAFIGANIQPGTWTPVFTLQYSYS